jgi:hypothetical protein
MAAVRPESPEPTMATEFRVQSGEAVGVLDLLIIFQNASRKG